MLRAKKNPEEYRVYVKKLLLQPERNELVKSLARSQK